MGKEFNMVEFNKEGFTITVHTHYPLEDYVHVVTDLIELIQNQENELTTRPQHALILLKSLVPDASILKLPE